MKMLHKRPLWKSVVLVLCAVMLTVATPISDVQVVSAAVSTFSSTTKVLVCGTQAKIKLPKGWSNCKFTSSNKKVATVTSKGIVKAVRLGVAKITVKSGSKKKIYAITVTPKNKSDVWLNQETILAGQKLQFSLASDKYDTSQVELTFDSGYSEINSKGKCTGIEGSGWADLYYSYGSFKKHINLVIWDPDDLFTVIMGNEWYEDTDECNVYAGDPYTIIVSLGWDETVKQTLPELRKQGVSVLLDGTEMEDTVVFTPGVHELSLVSGNVNYKKKINVSYSVKNALIQRDATGFSAEAKAVFDAAFSAVGQVVRDGMSDREKVKAIHDYLIYHANYVNNGNYATAENWAYGAEGVLLHREGVCQSYAIAFYMMATASGVDCEYVTGTATNALSSGGHAWNRVKIDGKWYYIDCTWDDPVGGGYEGYDYYLSETLWSDHTVEDIIDLSTEEKYMWEHYYLTGKGYSASR